MLLSRGFYLTIVTEQCYRLPCFVSYDNPGLFSASLTPKNYDIFVKIRDRVLTNVGRSSEILIEIAALVSVSDYQRFTTPVWRFAKINVI